MSDKGKLEYDDAFKLAIDGARPRSATDRMQFQLSVLRSFEASADLGFLPAMQVLQAAYTSSNSSADLMVRQPAVDWYRDHFGTKEVRTSSELAWLSQNLFLKLRSDDPAIANKLPHLVEVEFVQPKLKFRPPFPGYPQMARMVGAQGTVVVQVSVGPDGRVLEVKPVQGPDLLFETTTTWVKQWIFEPVSQNGKPQAIRFKVNVDFKLTPPTPPKKD